ncbi:homeobox protein Hox-D9-like [Mustela putorius furo]|uniref:Homeobox protein Hox-D9-like n=1 Tax=Mustela putorius furo TaxID=9669 RepID=A0A8U0S1J0_MUSPF|nr:homeobox protein Hox-D9-like [Mustela putorius furo]
MMLRSPLPAAAASHTASHVSLPLFFFFLTSARGGAATARSLTSPLLARPRPGRAGGGGAGVGGGPSASASPGPDGLAAAAGRGRHQRRRTEGEGPVEPSEPASRARDRARPPRRGARLGASMALVLRPAGPERQIARWLLSPPLSPSALTLGKGGQARARRAKGNCTAHLEPA